MVSKLTVILCAVFLAGGETSSLQKSALLKNFNEFFQIGVNADINDYVDYLVPSVVDFIVSRGLEPMPLPDYEDGFSVKPAFIEYHGQLQLLDGHLSNLPSLRRNGDAKISYFAKMVRVRVEFSFDHLEFEFKYRAKVMNIGPTGGVYGNVDHINVVADVLLDMNNDELQLQEYSLTDVGRLRVRLSGNFLTDWFVNPVISVVTRIFTESIMETVESNMRQEVQKYIDDINKNIKENLSNV